MSKLVALLALMAAAFFISLGNFWFTYGIWPRSWSSFVLFVVLALINQTLITVVSKEK